jgi:predicted component of viral defense system (DUF524 family)
VRSLNYKGNDQDLVFLETDLFKLIIKGKPIHPDVKQLYPERDHDLKARLEVNPLNCIVEDFKYFSPTNGQVKAESLDLQVYPFFYEQQNYIFFIEGKGNNKISFYHENRNIREAISYLPGKDNQLMGNINFRNDIGYSEFEIRANGQPLLLMTIEVFPSKIEYRTDYYKLLQEVNREIYNLSYDFLQRTFLGTSSRETSTPSLVEFFSIINIIFNNFIKAYRRIEKYPHHELCQTSRILPAARVKRINKGTIKWMRKNPVCFNQETGLPEKLLNIDKQVNFDTFENRFVKWLITQLIQKLNTFEKRYKYLTAENPDGEAIKRIHEMRENLNLILKNSFLQEVTELNNFESLSLVLQMAPGYKEIYKYYLVLIKGLSIHGEIFRLSMKKLWELYEYWCFLKLNSILEEKYHMVKHDLIGVNYQGIYVRLNKGASSRVEYRNPKTGERFTLSYNKYEGENITTGQKPDNVLTLKKDGSAVEYKFIFDAKYRLNPAYPGSDYYNAYDGIPGPEEATINAMHRYRDAIIKSHENKPERVVVGAFVLFPYHDEERFKEHRFYKSIEKVNVGAFPFLPGSTNLVSEFLENIIEESYLGNYERNVLPAGTDEYRNDMQFEQNVLVGSLRSREQFEIIYDKNFYYLPYQKTILKHNLEYVAIYQSERIFGNNGGIKYYGRIRDMEIKQRKDIEVPTSKNLNKNYIVFYLDKWKRLDRAIKPETYGIIGSHIYTNILLLEKARTLPELSVKTLEEWRIWLELKRIQPEIKVLLAEANLDTYSQVKGFELDGMQLCVEDGEIIIRKGKKIERVTKQEFLYNLRRVLKRLQY